MSKIVFENDELLMMAMFDGGTRRRTMDQIRLRKFFPMCRMMRKSFRWQSIRWTS